MKYQMKLVLGDWSDDGHGKYETKTYECNVPVEAVQEAYKASCKLTGIQFNYNQDYTGKSKPGEYPCGAGSTKHGQPMVAVEYEDCCIKDYILEDLNEFGLNGRFVSDEKSQYRDGYYIEDYPALWWWFVSLSLPDLEYKEIKDDVPCINGFWNDNLNVQFAYGMYD